MYDREKSLPETWRLPSQEQKCVKPVSSVSSDITMDDRALEAVTKRQQQNVLAKERKGFTEEDLVI